MRSYLPLGVDYMERRKTKKKKEMSQMKIRQDLYQGDPSQREERIRKTFLCSSV